MHIPGLLLFLKLITSILFSFFFFFPHRCAINDTARSSPTKMRCTLGWEFGGNFIVIYTIVRSVSQIHATLLSACLSLRKCKHVFQCNPKLGGR